MSTYFVAYSGRKPVSVTINGHKVILVTEDKRSLEDDLFALGADRLKPLKIPRSKIEDGTFITEYAKKNDAGVVFVEGEASPLDVIRALEGELPWIH